MNTFWHTPYRYGWMLLQAAMQSARHADAIYILFAIMLLNLFVSPPPGMFLQGGPSGWLWQALSFVLTVSLMTGWMQIIHARTWLLFVDSAKHAPSQVLNVEDHAPCRVVFKTGDTKPESGDSVIQDTSKQSTYIPPLADVDEDGYGGMEEFLEAKRPVLQRPVKAPFFQGIGRFWGRSAFINAMQSLLMLGLFIAPFAYLAVYAGVPETLKTITFEQLERLNTMDNEAMKAALMRLPRPEIQLLSQWAAGFCISMLLTVFGFLSTALWWPSVLVWDLSPLQGFALQWQYYRRDYIRALMTASVQFGVLGFMFMLQVSHTGNVFVDALLQVGIFFGFLFSSHLAFIYIYSVTRPPFITEEQQKQLAKAPTLEITA